MPNEYRLSADADEFEEGRKSYRQINLVGLDRRTGDGYGDCKERRSEVNRMAFFKPAPEIVEYGLWPAQRLLGIDHPIVGVNPRPV